MNIVHFSWEFPPVIYGGLGTFVTEITCRQVGLGNEVTVFSLNREKEKKMDQWIRELVTECMRLEGERKQFLIFMALTNPSDEMVRYFDKNTLREGKFIAKEELKTLGGLDEAMVKYSLVNRNYVFKFSELAEFLDKEDGFDDIERYRVQLSEEQFRWLKSHIKEIKKYL